MVENLKVISGNINWDFNNRNINLIIEDAFFASQNEELKMIKIDAGKNFIEKKVFYYDYNGNLELYYDLELGMIEWIFQGVKHNLIVNNMEQVGFFPQKQRILILCSCEKQELQGYSMMGELLFKVSNPSGFKMRYFAKMKDEIAVVCDGNKNYEDEYGRFRYNFRLNINNGNLIKGELAY